ncbi:hypothetical protein DdX_09617 [Ditylenchus destructor]|uniref:Uncharacterized protein n=1 Tax=Ditylenchus destructor TaxID=166010 RepID=A0AAD4R6E2_9BILA|nr:hypothetical protein DdX_09617 [Ditylenchus destructor]
MSTLQEIHSTPLPYVLSLPPNASKQKDWPVLCFLHGRDEAAPLPLQQAVTLWGPLSPKNPARIRNEFIIVVPQLPISGDDWHLYAGSVKDIVKHVQCEHGGDPKRTYLTGFSYGGNGVFDLGIKQSDFWAALWSVDPVRMPKEEVKPPTWLSIGEIVRPSTDAYIQQVCLNLLDEELGGDRYYLDEGQNHGGCAYMAYKDERIYDWLITKQLS